jgi:membrane fusion protein (multidrug efflux system)
MKNKSIFTLAIAAFIIISCGKEAPQQQAMGPMPFAVQKVIKENTTVFQEFSVNIEGQQNVEIRPKVNGFIQKIYVDEGQLVKKGQLLFKLETQTLNQDASAAKARVRAAQVEVDRMIPLVERNIISNVQLETAKANLAQAQSNYSSIASNINFGTITSPVDGVVGNLPYKEGSLVSSTNPEPLTTISDARNVRAYFSMNEKQLLQFNRTFSGQTMADKIKSLPEVNLILADNSPYEIKGKIETINGLVNGRTGSIQLRAEFKNPNGILRSGSSGTIQLPTEEKEIILIPQIAVFEMQGKQLVFVVDKSNKVSTKVIQTKGTSELNYIVSEGLNEGDLVVIEGVSKLRDGMEIIPNDTSKKTAQTATSAK